MNAGTLRQGSECSEGEAVKMGSSITLAVCSSPVLLKLCGMGREDFKLGVFYNLFGGRQTAFAYLNLRVRQGQPGQTEKHEIPALGPEFNFLKSFGTLKTATPLFASPPRELP